MVIWYLCACSHPSKDTQSGCRKASRCRLKNFVTYADALKAKGAVRKGLEGETVEHKGGHRSQQSQTVGKFLYLSHFMSATVHMDQHSRFWLAVP